MGRQKHRENCIRIKPLDAFDQHPSSGMAGNPERTNRFLFSRFASSADRSSFDGTQARRFGWPYIVQVIQIDVISPQNPETLFQVTYKSVVISRCTSRRHENPA